MHPKFDEMPREVRDALNYTALQFDDWQVGKLSEILLGDTVIGPVTVQQIVEIIHDIDAENIGIAAVKGAFVPLTTQRR